MFSNSLVFTTLIATLCAVSGANADPLQAQDPVWPVQCQDTPLVWTGGVPPFNVYVFTDCKDNNDAPIATFTNIKDNTVTWFTTLYSGDGWFYQVEDSTGAESFSNDVYLGGDANQIDACKQQVAAVEASASATPTTTPASSAPNNIPTTMSHTSTTSTTPIGANGVANAASDPTSGVQKAGSDKVANGASNFVVHPFELAAGLLAAGIVAYL